MNLMSWSRTFQRTRCLLALYTIDHLSSTIIILAAGLGLKSLTTDSNLLQLLMLRTGEFQVEILTERIRSPLLSSPLRSAGPPARIKETKMPSPSSPPTMLKPRPVEPLCSNTFLGSLPKRATVSWWRAGQRVWKSWAEIWPKLKETDHEQGGTQRLLQATAII